MRRIVIAAAAAIALSGGAALAQSGADHGEQMRGHHEEGYGHGGHHGDGMRHGGHRGGGDHGRGGIWKHEGAGFEMRMGRRAGLRVNCGDADITACVAASQALIDAMAKAAERR